jgi:hypothetical protein
VLSVVVAFLAVTFFLSVAFCCGFGVGDAKAVTLTSLYTLNTILAVTYTINIVRWDFLCVAGQAKQCTRNSGSPGCMSNKTMQRNKIL